MYVYYIYYIIYSYILYIIYNFIYHIIYSEFSHRYVWGPVTVLGEKTIFLSLDGPLLTFRLEEDHPNHFFV